jgi:hypothetical protein
MKLGADRKKLIYLAVFLFVGGLAIWTNGFSSWGSSDSGSSTAVRPAPVAAPGSAINGTAAVDPTQRRKEGQLQSSDWHPVYRDPKVVVDALKVDPTLRLDLLAKVQQVAIDPVQRNLFQFGAAPPPPQDKSPLPNVGKIDMAHNHPPGPMPAPKPPGPPAPPTAPAITFKYYGYSNARDNSRKRAFFLDGEDIIIASEGELIKKRYKLVKIGVNSVTMEDTQFSSQQTLPLAEDPTSANAAVPRSGSLPAAS